jgi:regulator of sirC expression with transglutaminase-like and TPR domain
MACEEYPQLELSPYLDQLDAMASLANRDIRPGDSPLETVRKINDVLFDTLGFRGNKDNYYDPRNSFFNDVLDRRMGIPITLSIVYLEVSRRLNVPIDGVGMPGHFVVKYTDREHEFFMDPFEKGQILTREDCQRKMQEVRGHEMEFPEHFLARATNRQILGRMLNNLKLIYLNAQAFDKGLAIVDMMILLQPDDFEQYRDRGLLRLKMRQFEGAARDLEHYLQGVPNAGDRENVESQAKELKRIRAMMN